MNSHLLVNLDEFRGGNVVIGPHVDDDRFRTNDLMLGFNRNDQPWESEMHYYERSKEIYVILKGGLKLRVGDELVDVRSGQMLVVNEGVAHDIEDFNLPMEFFTIRAPAEDDKVVVG